MPPALLVLALGSLTLADGPPLDLRLDLSETAGITGAALAASLATVLLKDQLAPHTCRICGTDGLDISLRRVLVWKDTAAASHVSDALEVGVPVLAAGALALSAWQGGGARTAGEDLLMATEAVSVALLATQVAKYAFGRVRPDAWANPSATRTPDSLTSMWSGHTSAAFAAAAAAGTVARLRGYRSWPWILGVALAGATVCGWMRIAADRHWATDVVAGAAIGSIAGLGLPVWLHGRTGAGGGQPGGVRLQAFPSASPASSRPRRPSGPRPAAWRPPARRLPADHRPPRRGPSPRPTRHGARRGGRGR